MNFSIPLVEIDSVLTIQINSGISRTKQTKAFRVDLTCRGFKKDIGMSGWFNMAHEIIINEFRNIFSAKMIETWEG